MITTILVNTVSVFVLGYLLPGVQVKNVLHAFLAAVVIVLLNFLVKPILLFFSFPITFLTLGLFVWVINALVLMLADFFLSGLKIKNFWWALLFAILLSVINSLLFMLVK